MILIFGIIGNNVFERVILEILFIEFVCSLSFLEKRKVWIDFE